MDWAKTDLGATKKNVSTLYVTLSCELYKFNSSTSAFSITTYSVVYTTLCIMHYCNIDNRYCVVYIGTVDCLVDSVVVIIIVIHMQPNAVSETWDASSVSETLDGGVR